MTTQPTAVVAPVVNGAPVVAGTPVAAGSGAGTMLAAVAPVSKVTRVIGGRDANWFLERTGELADVTDQASNPALGINSIAVFPASQKQMEYYTIANITLETVLGTIHGTQIKESNRVAGEIYLQTSSHNTAKADQPKKWVSDVKLNRAVQAQILSYVNSLLEPAQG
jgi:hypothetical protein